MQETLKAEL